MEQLNNYFHYTNLLDTGALQGVFLMAKVPFEEMAQSIVDLALISSKQFLTTFNPTFNLSKLIRKEMEEVLPDNIHLVVQDRLLVSMTKVWNPSNLAVKTQCRILGKFEYTRGPIFKVVLEC